ncbi:restriction endonuclease subunit S [Comamonas terrigena]|jgi:type I restriction enzyme S subunit|uniref:restriction endonuclease subunit S n=1 Tax=Comamonas terrigena TaxID=32013 RepID=UPI002446B96A|nr:restriction endonuclease subunit S [Comamonas terrigena]MDH0051355.1 restriction endonuclease subunit S [Comamonas terrigena]MDH0513773.1 restriction endonuclease subunit S [Comamonas terrigena]MDH1093384.1 restriction endonuclease subunit S [Comamonas terrigena]
MSFQRYPEYKDSGVEWLGKVPAHWNVKRLKQNLRLLTEKTDRRTNPVALENIESWSGRFIPTETEFEGEGIAFDKGDILFGKLRPYLAKALLAEAAGEAVGDFHVMRPQADVHARFAQYEILNRSFIDIVDGATFGSKMPRASWDFLASMPLPTPPYAEQTAIATFLDHETAKIDALVAEQEKLIALLQEKRQAVISHAVTKGLNPNAPMKDSRVEWLGEVPAHWEVKRLKYLGDAFIGLTYDPQDVTDSESGTLVLRSSNVQGGQIVYDDNVYVGMNIPEKAITREGDILICSRNGSRALIGKNALIDRQSAGVAFGAFMTVFRSPFNSYLRWVLNSQLFEFQSGAFLTSTINQLTVSNLYGFEIPLPPESNRKEISAFLDTATRRIDVLIAEARTAITLLQERRTALISAAVTGQIDVRNWSVSESA